MKETQLKELLKELVKQPHESEKDARMYPEIAIRELVANALIHQDLTVKGFPMIEIFSDRIEISNSGTPLVTPERFIDAYISRNEKLADIMRRMGFCEEKGSGLDKVIFYNELYQLPPINVVVAENRTRVTIYSYRTLNKLDKKEKIRACYQHACLKYVSNEKMTNQSLRERFKIESHNYSIASRIIRDALKEGVIKEDNPENMQAIYRFGHKILCDAYVMISCKSNINSLIYRHYLCDAYVIIKKILFDAYLTISAHEKHNSLIFKTFLFDSYLTISENYN